LLPVPAFSVCDIVEVMASARLQVTVQSACNLYNADISMAGKSDPYVIVEVPGQENMKFETSVANNTLNPIWNFTGEIDGFMDGDVLQFTVMDKDVWPKPDDFLGRVSLTAEDFYPQGFHAEVPLSESKTNATLTVMISIIGSNEPGEVMVEEGGIAQQEAVEGQTQYVTGEQMTAPGTMVTTSTSQVTGCPGTVTMAAPTTSTYSAPNVPSQSCYSSSPVTYSSYPTTQPSTYAAPMMSQPSMTYSAPSQPSMAYSAPGGQTGPGKVTQVIVHEPRIVTAEEFAQTNGTIVSTPLPVTLERKILDTVERAVGIDPVKSSKKKSRGCC